MVVLGSLISALAAYRLRETPLFWIAVISAALNASAVFARAAFSARSGSVSRAATALAHITAALGGFFLFVSFALR